MPYTAGFDPAELPIHFKRHGADFGAANPALYEQLADAFLGSPRDVTTTDECTRRRGDIVRYNRITQEFGVLSAAGIIRTYFKPDPQVHKQPTNLQYFYAECNKY